MMGVFFCSETVWSCFRLGAFMSHAAGVLDSFLCPESPVLSCPGVLMGTCILCPGSSHCLLPAHGAAGAPTVPCTAQRLGGAPDPASSTGPRGTIPRHSLIHAHVYALVPVSAASPDWPLVLQRRGLSGEESDPLQANADTHPGPECTH